MTSTTTTHSGEGNPTGAVQGSCLCGAIRFEISGGGLSNNVLCFCNSCRKSTGSVGMANSFCPEKDFTLLTPPASSETGGGSQLKVYADTSCDSGGTLHRSFCAACGSTMWAENRARFPGVYIVPFGALDLEDPAATAEGGAVWAAPKKEFFVKRKAPWFSTPAEGVTRFVGDLTSSPS